MDTWIRISAIAILLATAAHAETPAQSVVTLQEAQYHMIATTTGKTLEMCVQAGFVKAAALQAQNPKAYQHWDRVETLICSASRGGLSSVAAIKSIGIKGKDLSDLTDGAL